MLGLGYGQIKVPVELFEPAVIVGMDDPGVRRVGDGVTGLNKPCLLYTSFIPMIPPVPTPMASDLLFRNHFPDTQLFRLPVVLL